MLVFQVRMAYGRGMGKKTGQPKAGTYVMYGRHACISALNNPQRRIKSIWLAQEKWLSDIPEPFHASIIETDAKALSQRLGQQAVHQGIAVELDPLPHADFEEILLSTPNLLLLDQLTDPQNVGAILRSAAAFDIGAVIAPKDHLPVESGALAKAACGALELVPIIAVTNLASAMQEMKQKGYWLLGLSGDATEPIGKASEFAPAALVIGAEGKGLRPRTSQLCDLLLHIPISGQMESLNASNAAAIACYVLFTANTSE